MYQVHTSKYVLIVFFKRYLCCEIVFFFVETDLCKLRVLLARRSKRASHAVCRFCSGLGNVAVAIRDDLATHVMFQGIAS